jgi:FMN phosphatase YigB (HAD superfamily)
MAQPAAVFCDVGGPIFDDENFVAAVLAALDELRAADRLPPVDREQFRLLYDRGRQSQRGSLRAVLAETFLGDRGRRAELHERTKAHWVHPEGTMYGDVLPFLRSLEGRVRFGILANQEEGVIRALERDGVAPFVDIWGVSAVVGHEKPSAALFRWCLDQAGVLPNRAVHIGNRLDTDVRPAHALGLGTVWLLRGEAPDDPTEEQIAEADITVRSLDGLADRVLELIDSRG